MYMDSIFRYLVSHRSSTRNCAMALGEEILWFPQETAQKHGLNILTLDDEKSLVVVAFQKKKVNSWLVPQRLSDAEGQKRAKYQPAMLDQENWELRAKNPLEISFAKQISSTCWTKRNMNPKCPKSIWWCKLQDVSTFLCNKSLFLWNPLEKVAAAVEMAENSSPDLRRFHRRQSRKVPTFIPSGKLT